MRLSELKTGQTAVIVRVMGHGGFRKRIVEMGFIKGKSVEVLLNAPLHDPVKYKVMDYEVSLRRAEAELVEVVSEEEAKEAVKRIDKETKEEDRKWGEEMRKAEEELREITMKVLKDIGADEDTVKYIEGRMFAFCGVKYEYENVRRTIEGCIKRRNERKVHENNEL